MCVTAIMHVRSYITATTTTETATRTETVSTVETVIVTVHCGVKEQLAANNNKQVTINPTTATQQIPIFSTTQKFFFFLDKYDNKDVLCGEHEHPEHLCVQIHAKIKLMEAGHLLAILNMSPSTTSKSPSTTSK